MIVASGSINDLWRGVVATRRRRQAKPGIDVIDIPDRAVAKGHLFYLGGVRNKVVLNGQLITAGKTQQKILTIRTDLDVRR